MKSTVFAALGAGGGSWLTLALTDQPFSLVVVATVAGFGAMGDAMGAFAYNRFRRPLTDAMSLLNNRCPDCGSPVLELTSDEDFACVSCGMVYHPPSETTVVRKGREKTDESNRG